MSKSLKPPKFPKGLLDGLKLMDFKSPISTTFESGILPKQQTSHYLREPEVVYRKESPVENTQQLNRIEDLLVKVISLNAKSKEKAILAKSSDFIFNEECLLILHKGKILDNLTRLEIILCRNIFMEDIGYQFQTKMLEEILYPNDRTGGLNISEKFKKVVFRFNEKIFNQTGVRNMIVYSNNYISRKS